MIPMSVAVIVGGDLARSTRIVQHARVLAARGARVRLAGHAEAPFVIDGVEVHVVPSFDRLRGRGALFYPAALPRQLLLAIAWWRTLRRIRCGVTILQNPPAFPLLLLTNRKSLIIDWHNTTAAMLRLQSGDSLLVRLVSRLEWRLARKAAGHLAVSNALREHLRENGIDAEVLYDAPPRHAAAQRARGDEVRIMVPTSWSSDDDFDLLQQAASRWTGRKLRFVLTGRGPRRDAVRFRSTEHVAFEKRWYEADAYPDALASADLGLSVHRGGLDLPMKIVEMLGNGLPVCVLDYGPVLRERYADGTGVRFFSDAASLVSLLTELLQDDAKPLDALRASAHHAMPRTWDDEWTTHAEPLLNRVSERVAQRS